jgi:3D (Asp-Asp-Asp) domain-containing protein
MRRLVWLLTTLATGCTGVIDGTIEGEPEVDAGSVVDASAPDAVLPPPSVDEPGDLVGSYFWTFYYVTEEQRYLDQGEVDDTNLYEKDGSNCLVIAEVPAKFASSVKIEGTGRLADHRVINYTGSCSCPTSPCYHEVDAAHPWGSGAGGRPLVPFRSVAVDRDVVFPFGRALYIVELDGQLMPGDAPWGGFVHDGCVYAEDTGGGIDGEHLDFFSALRPYYLAISSAMDLPADHVTVHDGGLRCRDRL